MLFNSFHFVFFFIIITVLYFLTPHRFRWFLLLAGSCYFYMAFIPVYILILGFTIIVDYFAGIWLEKTEGKNRKYFLIASLIANIGVLAVFKYYNFLNTNLSVLLNTFGYTNTIPNLGLILPIAKSRTNTITINMARLKTLFITKMLKLKIDKLPTVENSDQQNK